jgi:hypothetical protein
MIIFFLHLGSYISFHSSIENPKNTPTTFKSKSARFDDSPKKSLIPGPGSYDTGNLMTKKSFSVRNSGKSDQNHSGVMWVKVSTAPSIPSYHQSHGYEEGNRTLYCIN